MCCCRAARTDPGKAQFPWVVTLMQPNRYDSRMKILVKNQRVDVAITPQATTGGSAPTVDNDVSENQINSEIELLTSKDLLTQVVNETELAKSEVGWFGRPAPESVRVEEYAANLNRTIATLRISDRVRMLGARDDVSALCRPRT
jgi:hypothetical protein